jgi:hypothetical protein
MQLDERAERFVRKKLADLDLGGIDLPSTPENTGLWTVTSESREMMIRLASGWARGQRICPARRIYPRSTGRCITRNYQQNAN